MAYRTYANTNGFIVAQNGTGDFTTISSAVAAVTNSGLTTSIIYLTYPSLTGSYNESFTLPAGCSLTTMPASSTSTTPIIINGTVTFSAIGSAYISSITLQTNGSYALVVSGSNSSSIFLTNVSFNCSNYTGINFTCTNASSNIQVLNSFGNLLTTGIAYHAMTSPGRLTYDNCSFQNFGGSSTQSTNSAGIVQLANSLMSAPLASTGVGQLRLYQSNYFDTSLQNVTCLTIGGTGGGFAYETILISGTAAAFFINASCSFTLVACTISSTNTNAIDGQLLSSLQVGLINYTSSSSKVNTNISLTPVPTLVETLQLNPAQFTLGSLPYATSAGTIGALTPATNGDVLQLKAGVPAWSTPSFPISVGGAGTILRSDGTNWAATTATYPATTTVNQILYSSTANTISGLATANNAVVNTSGAGVPSLTTYPQVTGLGIGASPGSTAGITFDGSNFINNYAVGTWTPTVYGSSTAGTTTYSAIQNGYYVRIGAFVQIQCEVGFTAATGTGNFTFGGLPFTIKNQTNGLVNGPIEFSNITYPTNTTYVVVRGVINTQTATPFACGSVVGQTSVPMVNTSATIIYSLCHEI